LTKEKDHSGNFKAVKNPPGKEGGPPGGLKGGKSPWKSGFEI